MARAYQLRTCWRAYVPKVSRLETGGSSSRYVESVLKVFVKGIEKTVRKAL